MTTRNARIVAGAGLLLLAALGPFIIFVEGLVTPGDAAQTATNIIDAEGLFRFGVVALFAVAALDVVVAWALLSVFRPASESLSMLAAWFRLAYAGVLMVAIAELVGVLDLLGTEEHRSVFGADQVHAQALLKMESFSHILAAGFVLFGLHLLVLGYLAYRSGYVPRLLGVLVAVAGFGYVFDSLVAVLTPDPWLEITTFTFIGELLLAFWLVISGRRRTLEPAEAGVPEAPAAVAR